MKVEGIITYDEEVHNPLPLILCPPHPHLGGDMENNVIATLANVLAERPFVSLRFNYRGVGNSEREHNIANRVSEFFSSI